jgi:heme iron utilization protein
MSSSSSRKHASGTTSGQSAVPEPGFAERSRTLMHTRRIGSLSTQSLKQGGFPFGSLMPYALDAQGRPIFLISTMAMHTQNLEADPRASLFVTEADTSSDPLGSSRVTVIGNVIRLSEPELASSRAVYLTSYPDSKYWVDFDDFYFYRMDVVDVYYVGGFGVMGWVAASEYYQAEPDPLLEWTSEIIRHMNADHRDALILLSKRFGGIEALEANMTSVDRLGFHVRAKTQDGVRGARIGFLREVRNPAQTREVFVEMVRQAREEYS